MLSGVRVANPGVRHGTVSPDDDRCASGHEPKAQPVRGGPWPNIQAVCANPLNKQPDNTVQDEVERNYVATSEPAPSRPTQHEPAQHNGVEEVEDRLIEKRR